MELKLIFSTFFVIFLAELGDKTQFAAMAASAGSNKPVSILIGAVLALTVSSVIAVAAGAVIGNLLPVKYIKIAAGVLFIIFGLLYIKESFTVDEIHQESAPVQDSRILGSSIIKAAKVFEEEELNMLTAAVAKTGDVNCRAVIERLIEQDKKHLNILSGITNETASDFEDDLTGYQFLMETFACSDEDDDTLRRMYEREKAIADFYRIMSEKTRIASVRSALLQLYNEEKKHADSIKILLGREYENSV